MAKRTATPDLPSDTDVLAALAILQHRLEKAVRVLEDEAEAESEEQP